MLLAMRRLLAIPWWSVVVGDVGEDGAADGEEDFGRQVERAIERLVAHLAGGPSDLRRGLLLHAQQMGIEVNARRLQFGDARLQFGDVVRRLLLLDGVYFTRQHR